ESIKQNQQSGTDRVINDYNFSGALVSSFRVHMTSPVDLLEVNSIWEYDHMGRKTKSRLNINSIDYILSALEYTETGQLYRKKLHSEDDIHYIENISYTYNPRGWLKEINSEHLKEKLYYETAPLSGITPNYN